MTMRTIVLIVAALLAVGSTLHAQEPVVGVKDPESLFKDSDPTLNRNKQATLHIMRELLQCGQWDRAGEWLTQAYHQHNPNAASGLDGVIAFFTKVLKVKRVDKRDKLTTEVVAVIADDDYVTVLMPRKYPDPSARRWSTTPPGSIPGGSSMARPTSIGIRLITLPAASSPPSRYALRRTGPSFLVRATRYGAQGKLQAGSHAGA